MAYDQQLPDANRRLDDAGKRLYVLEAENERLQEQLKIAINALKVIDDIAVSHRAGGIGQAQKVARTVLHN